MVFLANLMPHLRAPSVTGHKFSRNNTLQIDNLRKQKNCHGLDCLKSRSTTQHETPDLEFFSDSAAKIKQLLAFPVLLLVVSNSTSDDCDFFRKGSPQSLPEKFACWMRSITY